MRWEGGREGQRVRLDGVREGGTESEVGWSEVGRNRE